MNGPVHLPKMPLPVEPRRQVRARARRRVGAVAGILGIMLSAIAARGAQLCVAPNDRTIAEGSAQRWDQVTRRARRGEILDRNGRRLATSVATPNIVIDPLRISEADVGWLSTRLSMLLDVPEEHISTKMKRKSRYARIAMRVHPMVAADVEALEHPGVWAERSSRRYYPEGVLGSQLLGFVDASGVGREGLEAALDDYLRGGAILVQRRRDRRGLDVDNPTMGSDVNVGMNVHTTLDRTIQHIAERALEGVMVRHEPANASAVVVDVRTGDILAMANMPTFNPNAMSQDAAPRRNHVVQDAIEPGSVFKPFTMAAAVEEGLVTETSIVDCEGGAWYIGRTRIRDDHPHGAITASEVIKYSSNIGAAKMALRVGASKFLDYMHAFGFGQRTGIKLPGERRGVLRRADKIRPIELATTSYGQGVTATPLQVVMATAAIANGGVRMTPRMVHRVEDLYGVPEVVQRPQVASEVVSRESAEAVARMMVTVTERGGTATRAQVPGYRVAGKTGTAEKVKDGKYSQARIGSFMGFVPADDPAIAIVVTVDEPTKGSRYGGIVAAPAFAEIAGLTLRHLGIRPDPMLLEAAEEDEVELPADRDPLQLTWSGQGWTLPDLTGRPLREILAGLQGTGIGVRFEGTGSAVEQRPAAGAVVPMGAEVVVKLN